jgi:hypothetical protein
MQSYYYTQGEHGRIKYTTQDDHAICALLAFAKAYRDEFVAPVSKNNGYEGYVGLIPVC